MSLRILIQPADIQNWLAQRQAQPARRRNTDADFRILFDRPSADCEPLSVEDFLTALRLSHHVLLVDEEPGKTFHRFVPRA
jgi:hypothetical protein